MLVLSRQVGERLFLRCRCGRKTMIQLVRVKPGQCRLGIAAPRDVEIIREGLPSVSQPAAAENETEVGVAEPWTVSHAAAAT